MSVCVSVCLCVWVGGCVHACVCVRAACVRACVCVRVRVCVRACLYLPPRVSRVHMTAVSIITVENPGWLVLAAARSPQVRIPPA